jgi:hypothetical protein
VDSGRKAAGIREGNKEIKVEQKKKGGNEMPEIGKENSREWMLHRARKTLDGFPEFDFTDIPLRWRYPPPLVLQVYLLKVKQSLKCSKPIDGNKYFNYIAREGDSI